MKANLSLISRLFHGGEYFPQYFHGAPEESSLDHECHKCMFHGHENKDNQFFMALSRLFNTSWFHSVVHQRLIFTSGSVHLLYSSPVFLQIKLHQIVVA